MLLTLYVNNYSDSRGRPTGNRGMLPIGQGLSAVLRCPWRFSLQANNPCDNTSVFSGSGRDRQLHTWRRTTIPARWLRPTRTRAGKGTLTLSLTKKNAESCSPRWILLGRVVPIDNRISNLAMYDLNPSH
jgi:hypothetical protein